MLNTDMPLAPQPPVWLLKPADADACGVLEGKGVPAVIARLLSQRGVGADTVDDFLSPRLASLSDPFDLPGMEPMVTRLLDAVDGCQTVLLYGDYDVDGVSSMALMLTVLQAYGLNCQTFLPHRLAEGYGLSLDGLGNAFSTHGKPELLVALDCGTTSLAETAWLREQGVDCVIIDHHEVSPDGLPQCAALVNPQLGSGYHYFCTVGLVFKVAHALLKRRRLDSFDLRHHLDLVALGTVADLVPLIDENRLLVRRGLETLSTAPRVGVRALKEIAGVDGLVQTHHVGYRLSPRLNAAGRLDTAFTALNLLLADDPDLALECAQQLDSHNRERQTVEQRVFDEAIAALGDLDQVRHRSAIVLGSRNWHPGVIGIVASRISRLFHRPTILVAIDDTGMGKGSGRSVQGFSLVEAIEECREFLVRGGGHAMAAGISVREEMMGAFAVAFEASARRAFEGGLRQPVLELDAELDFAAMTPAFYNHFRMMEPFGQRNCEPLFLVRNVTPKPGHKVIKERHLRLLLRQGRHQQFATWFHAPVGNTPPAPWDVALRLQRNWYRGEERWQFTIDAARPAQA
jgi:single-stranded-DNA-specific exonuclease